MARLPLWSLAVLVAGCGPSPTEPQVAPVATVTPPASASAAASLSTPPPPRPLDARVPVRDSDARWGSDQAPVTIVVFGLIGVPDQTSGDAKIDEMQRKFGPDKVRVVWKGLVVEDRLPGFKQAQVVAGVARVGQGEVVRKFVSLAHQRPADAFQID